MPAEYPLPLTASALRAAKPQKLFDGNALFLFISPNGTKSWRVKYHFQGREKLLKNAVKMMQEWADFLDELRDENIRLSVLNGGIWLVETFFLLHVSLENVP